MSWLQTRGTLRSDGMVAGGLALVVLVGVGLWWLGSPDACLMGEDSLEWARATKGLHEFDPVPLLTLRRQPLLPLLAALLPLPVPTALALVSALAAALGVALTWLVPARMLGRGAGLAALVATPALVLEPAVYANADALAAPLFLGLVWGIWRLRLRHSPRLAALLGVALALASLGRPHVLLLGPVALWASWPGGWRARLSLLAGGLVLLPWGVLTFTMGKGSVLTMVATDSLGFGPEVAQKTAMVDKTGGLSALATHNASTMAGTLLRWLPGPLSLGAAWLLATEADTRAALATLTLAGAGALLALPFLFQPEHLHPFLLVLVGGGAALVPLALGRPGWWRLLAGLPLLLLALTPGALRENLDIWDSRSQVSTCSQEVLDVARWIGSQKTDPRARHFLSHPNPGLQFHVPGASPVEKRARLSLIAPRGRAPTETLDLWVPLLPDEPDRTRWEREIAAGRLRDEVKVFRVACGEGECLVLRLHVAGRSPGG